MDPQEIEQFREQVKQLTETLQQLNGAAEASSKTIGDELSKKFPNAAKPTIAGLSGLGDAASSAASAIYRGERGAKAMADAFGKVADTISEVAAIVTLFTPWGQALSRTKQALILGGAAITKATSEFAKLTAEQTDELYKTYRSLSEVGAAGSNGLEGLINSLQRAGFTVAELGEFAAAIKRNAKDLTYFGASASDGAKNLTAISGAIVKSDLGRALEMMGYSAASIADSTATYLVLQQRLGRVQTKTATELAIEGAKFALEMDKMARFTGMSREEQEQARKSLIQDERYAGFMATEAREQGLNTTAIESVLTAFRDPEIQRGLAHLLASGGAPTSEESRRVLQTDPRAYDLLMAAARNQMTPVQVAQQISQSMGQYAQGYGGQLARFGATGPGVRIGGEFGALGQSTRAAAQLEAARQAGFASLDAYLDSEQKKTELNKGELKRQVETRRTQMSAAQALDSTVEGLNGLNAATSGLTSAFEKLTRVLPGAAGGRPTTGGGAGFGGAGGSAAGVGMTPPGGVSIGAPDYSGLKIKSGESTAGGGVSPNLISVARNIQDQLGGNLKYFSAFNDSFHQGTDSAHAAGRALDFVLTDPSTAASVAAFVRNMAGVKSVRDEYNNPSTRATAGHIHAEISARNGFDGIISGPSGGYRPNLEMHSAERMKIEPIAQTSDRAAATEGTMMQLIDRVDELIYVQKSQLGVNEKMLKYQQ